MVLVGSRHAGHATHQDSSDPLSAKSLWVRPKDMTEICLTAGRIQCWSFLENQRMAAY